MYTTYYFYIYIFFLITILHTVIFYNILTLNNICEENFLRISYSFQVWSALYIHVDYHQRSRECLPYTSHGGEHFK